MHDLESLEQLLQENFIASSPNQVFKSALKQQLLQSSGTKRKKVLYLWLGLTLTGIVAGVALYGLATLIKKNEGKLLCCRSGVISEGSS